MNEFLNSFMVPELENIITNKNNIFTLIFS